jgi:hypothetical protein
MSTCNSHFVGLLYLQSIALASSQPGQRGQLANVGRDRCQPVVEQVPISQATSVLQFTLLACSVCRESLWFPHRSFSAVNLPMSDGIDVNWFSYKYLSITQCQFCNLHCWLCSVCRASLLLPHSQVSAVNLPMSDGTAPVNSNPPNDLEHSTLSNFPFVNLNLHERQPCTLAFQNIRHRTTCIHRKSNTIRRRAPYTVRALRETGSFWKN